jgi:hypothetical protein
MDWSSGLDNADYCSSKNRSRRSDDAVFFKFSDAKRIPTSLPLWKFIAGLWCQAFVWRGLTIDTSEDSCHSERSPLSSDLERQWIT